MLTGNKYPQNFRPLRMLEEELLIDLVKLPEVASFTDLVKVLEDRTMRNRTTKMWTESLFKAVIIMIKFLVLVMKTTGPSSSCNRSYAAIVSCCRISQLCAVFYILHSPSVKFGLTNTQKTQTGAFVRHNPRVYNSTWTDMFIETTYMRLGH